MHAAFEVAVAGQYGADDQVVAVDGLRDRLGQGAGVADAGGTAVADQVETQAFQVGREPGCGQVVGDHLGTGRQGRLHPGLALQAALHRVLRQQTGGHQHAGVGCIGAGGDGGDDHGAMAQPEGLLRHGKFAFGLRGSAAGFQQQIETGAHVREGHPILRALGSGQRGLHAVQVEAQGFTELRLGTVAVTPQALGPAIGFHQGDARLVAAGQAQVVEGHRVHREESAGGAIFRRHVADGGAVGQRQGVQPGAVELHELADHAVLAQHLGDGEYQVGGGHPFAQPAAEAHAHHFRDQHGHRLAEHGRLRLDAADAPAEHAEAVDHGGVRIGADQAVGKGQQSAVMGLAAHDVGQVFEIHLVTDAGARRHHAEVGERLLTPAQEGVAFGVALHLDGDVLGEGARIGEAVDHHRMVDDQIHGNLRIDPPGIAARPGGGVAHSGQVDHRRHAGEVLHQHARRAVLDLVLRTAFTQPVDDRLAVLPAHRPAILPAQQVLQQHLERQGQAREVAEAVSGLRQAVIVVGLPADLQGAATVQAVQCRHGEAPGKCHGFCSGPAGCARVPRRS